MSDARKKSGANGNGAQTHGASERPPSANGRTGVSESPLGVRAAFAGKHLLVTGVTGFLGKVWLAMVLDRLPEVGHVTVLVRSKKGTDPVQRFHQIVECSPAFRPLRQRLGAVAFREMIHAKVRVVEAHLVEPRCGLSLDAARKLVADVDAVVHFAGLTDFEPDPQQAIDANIHGAQHVADLAAQSAGKRYVHVSTTFVAGMRSETIEEVITPGVAPNGATFDPPEELRVLEAGIAALSSKKARIDFAMARAQALGWPNIYTYSKGLSEHLLEPRTDIRSTTFRPAIVECARDYPFEGWNEGINTSGPIVWLLATTFQRFPARPTNNFDIVPVDTVARSMMLVVAAALRDDSEAVYQCASSHLNPFAFRRAVDLCGLAIRKLHLKSDKSFERRVLARLDPVCMEPNESEVLGFRRMRSLARATRNFCATSSFPG